MTKKEFLNSLSNDKADVLQHFLDTLSTQKVDYCLIGGLAVNAYAEPVVSLDLDVVIAAKDVDRICEVLKPIFDIEVFPHSINLSTRRSDLRIQLQIDSRYQGFIPRARSYDVLGYRMMVAGVEDVLQGKIWAYMDEQRRRSKRQKDLADILRLIEKYPSLEEMVPDKIRKRIE